MISQGYGKHKNLRWFLQIRRFFLIVGLVICTMGLIGCPITEDPGDAASVEPDDAASVEPESCVTCHSNAAAEHQEVYDAYLDESTLDLTIVGVSSSDNGDGTYDATTTFTITQNGAAYVDADELDTLNQKRIYAVTYDSGINEFITAERFESITATATPGQYTAIASGITFAPESSNGIVYAYIAKDELDSGPAGGHVHLYDDVSSAGISYGDGDSYESAAVVSGCEKCHGAPYGKHGYRQAAVDGLSDFASCKVCHYDSREGGHFEWQALVTDPERFAEFHNYTGDEDEFWTEDEKEKYAYVANVMNDTHMSHGMEFPYPQSMANCATCHDGKLDMILTDANFVASTCKSCHPVTAPEGGTDAHRAPALETLWADAGVDAMHSIDADCTACHKAGGSGSVFTAYHSGYDKHIYADDDGTRYADIFTVTIDSASLTGNILTFNFSAAEGTNPTALAPEDIIPTVMVGLYGYDTKDIIVSPHSRDDDDERLLELQIDGESTNPRITVVSAANGSWEVTADLTMWADMIADGSVKRAEISVMPLLADIVGELDSRDNDEEDDTNFALDAASRTFDLTANAFADDYFTAIIDVEKCNVCHDALGTTFHSPARGGSIAACKQCHFTGKGGSHLEMQSRSLDSYVHAIHSFQAFDSGDVDMTDPVEAAKYDVHIGHVIPTFTAKGCEVCHIEGYDVPEQSKSLPGILSASDTWDTDRDISDVPSYVTGPASRACGACHRAMLINEDEAGELMAFNQHTQAGGYLVEDEDGVLDTVIETIMAFFD
jgi:OmcA/MtrC family decaheme c-type cytochrome